MNQELLKSVPYVAFGGAIGAVLRFALSVRIGAALGGEFPFGTLAVNFIGCFAIGALSPIVGGPTADPGRLFLIVGVLGGFTTFSAFGYESLELIERGALGAAAGYAALSVVGGVGLAALGQKIFNA